jgi:hypothetical protein
MTAHKWLVDFKCGDDIIFPNDDDDVMKGYCSNYAGRPFQKKGKEKK